MTGVANTLGSSVNLSIFEQTPDPASGLGVAHCQMTFRVGYFVRMSSLKYFEAWSCDDLLHRYNDIELATILAAVIVKQKSIIFALISRN